MATGEKLGYIRILPFDIYIPVYNWTGFTVTEPPEYGTITVQNMRNWVYGMPSIDSEFYTEYFSNSRLGFFFNSIGYPDLMESGEEFIKNNLCGGAYVESTNGFYILGLSLYQMKDQSGYCFGYKSAPDEDRSSFTFEAIPSLNETPLSIMPELSSIEVFILARTGVTYILWKPVGSDFADVSGSRGNSFWQLIEGVPTPVKIADNVFKLYDEAPPPPIEALFLSLTKPGPNTDDEVAEIGGFWTRGTVELKRNESYTFEYRLIMDTLDREKDIPYEDISYGVFINEIMPGFDPVPYPLSPDDPNYEKVNKTFSITGNTITISDECYFPTVTIYAYANNVIVTNEYADRCVIRVNITDNLGPYNPDGTTKPGQEGGDGLFGDNINDQIEAPDGSAEGPDGAGLYTRYLVTSNTMHVFGEWLWTEDLGLAIAKAAVGLIYGSPADTLISLVSYPFSVGAIAGTGSANVKWGGFDTGLSWPTLASNAGTINWGSVSINKFWGNFLDYSPHTKIELYLPWGTGFVEIDTNQVMEGSISVKTNIEFAKGTCVHLVYNHRGSLIGSYSATVGKSLPITASDFASKQVAVAGAAIGLAVGATISAGAGISAGIEGAGQVSYHNIVVPGRAAPITRGAVSGFDTAAASGEFARTLPNAARPALQAAAASTRMPASYHRSGSFQEGSAGLGVQYPFIILSRPKQSMPQSYGHYYGYPCNKVLGLGGCFGYTEVAEVHLDGVPATDAELIEIDRLLKGGVLL